MGKLLLVPDQLHWPGSRPRCYLPKRDSFYLLKWRRCHLSLWWRPWRGIHVSGLWFPGESLIQPPPESRRWRFPDMRKKSAKAGSDGGKHQARVETEIFSGLMSLVEHMAITKYDDDDARVTGWLRIGTSGAGWVVKVNDPDSGMSFPVVAETLDKALETAALLLACDEAPWQPDPFLAKGKKKSRG